MLCPCVVPHAVVSPAASHCTLSPALLPSCLVRVARLRGLLWALQFHTNIRFFFIFLIVGRMVATRQRNKDTGTDVPGSHEAGAGTV